MRLVCSSRQVFGLCLLDLRGQLELAVCYFRLAELAISLHIFYEAILGGRRNAGLAGSSG